MSHTAEIIAVGTELLLGNIVNTNAQEISPAGVCPLRPQLLGADEAAGGGQGAQGTVPV